MSGAIASAFKSNHIGIENKLEFKEFIITNNFKSNHIGIEKYTRNAFYYKYHALNRTI